jgi:hypothetical protein
VRLQPIEDPVYDPATRCSKTPRPGMAALQRWLEANLRGINWGTYIGLTKAGAARRTSFWSAVR